MSLEIYTGATPNGWKITVMVEELLEAGADLPAVNYHTVSLGGEQFTPAFMAIHLVRVPKAEIDQFSEERKARYRQSGAGIASNSALKTDV